MYGFEAIIESRKIIGVCKEKEVAINEYDDVISKGGGAILLEQNNGTFFNNLKLNTFR